MNFDMLLVFGLLAAAMVLFMTERIRMDVAAMLVLLALMLTGILTPDQALAGFADPVVLMIAGLLVVGSGLYQTGVAHAIGALLTRVAGDSEPRLIVVSMIAVALLSALMSSAGATAVLIPVIVSMAWRARISPARLLLPLAIGSLLGGLLTLIGTPPNLVVSGELVRHGLAPLSFFSFTPIGLATLGLGIVFMLTLGRRLLPQKTHSGGAYNDPESNVSLGELGETYDLPEDLMRVRVRASSPLVGMTLREAALRPRYHVNVLEVQHWPHRRAAPEEAHPVTPESHLEIDDILHVQGEPANVTQMAQEERLGLLSGGPDASLLFSDELGMVELLLPPRSQLLGRTLQENRFRDKYDVTVLSLKRGDKVLAPEESAATRLRFGDTLLVLGTWARIRLLQEERRNFVVVGLPKEMLEVQRTPAHALISGVIMVGMLALMTLEIMPAVTAVLLAAVAMVLTESLTMEQVYGAMNWQSLILLAGMLPLASALQATGGVTFIANALTASLGSMGPVTVMAGIFLLTALFSQFISNTATTVLMAPIAYQAAVTLGVAPQGFLVAVAVAASTAFAMPMATMSTTMVMAPGGYRIRDYVRIGLALQAFVFIVTLIILPLLFPF